jgi:hypothetical protein
MVVFNITFDRGEGASYLATQEGLFGHQILERDEESETFEVRVSNRKADDFEAQASDAIEATVEGVISCIRIYEV